MAKQPLIWVGVGCATIVMIAGLTYVQLFDQLAQVRRNRDGIQQQLNATQQERDDLSAKLNQLTDEVAALKQEKGVLETAKTNNEKELAQRLAEIRQLQSNVQVVSQCLTKIVGVIDAANKEDPARLILSLSGLEEPCERSEAILQEVENYPTN